MTDSAPYQSHSDTSKEAARLIVPSLGDLQAVVYGFIKMAGPYGATDQEMQESLDLVGTTQRPRRVELFQKGLIGPKEGDNSIRYTRTGRSARVWVAPQPGERLATWDEWKRKKSPDDPLADLAALQESHDRLYKALDIMVDFYSGYQKITWQTQRRALKMAHSLTRKTGE